MSRIHAISWGGFSLYYADKPNSVFCAKLAQNDSYLSVICVATENQAALPHEIAF